MNGEEGGGDKSMCYFVTCGMVFRDVMMREVERNAQERNVDVAERKECSRECV